MAQRRESVIAGNRPIDSTDMEADMEIDMEIDMTSKREEDVAISAHAAKRMRQRGLSQADVAYVLKHGQKRHAADAKIYFLRDKDLPRGDRRQYDRLRGAAVILSSNVRTAF